MKGTRGDGRDVPFMAMGQPFRMIVASLSLVFSLSLFVLLVLTLWWLPAEAGFSVLDALAQEKGRTRIEAQDPRVQLDEKGLKLVMAQMRVDSQRQTIDARSVRLRINPAQIMAKQASLRSLRVASIEAVSRPAEHDAGGSVPLERFIALLSRGAAGDIDLPRITIVYETAEGRPPIVLENGSLEAGWRFGGYGVAARMPFALDNQRSLATMDVLSAEDGLTSLVFETNGTPVMPLLTAAGVDAVNLHAQLAGRFSMRVDSRGNPFSGMLDLTLAPGDGTMAGRAFSIGQNRVRARFAPGSPVFEIDELIYDVAQNSGVLAGEVAVQNLLDPSFLKLDFDVQAKDVHLDLGAIMEGPLDIPEAKAAGSFDAETRHVGFDALSAIYFGSAMEGSLALTFPEGFSANPRIQSDAVLPGPLTPQEVLAGWPLNLARAARDWVKTNLSSGRLTNLRYTSDIPTGAVQPQTPLGNDTMHFTFDAADATVSYVPTMPPLEKLKASATVRGNTFSIVAESGEVKGVTLADGRVEIPRFIPGGAEASFTGRLSGDLPTVLRALEASDLVQFDEGGLGPDDYFGSGTFGLNVTWPMRNTVQTDDVVITGNGVFGRAALEDILPGVDFVDAAGTILLNETDLTVSGGGLIAAAPADFTWRRARNGAQRTSLVAKAELDHVAADMLGLPLRQFLSGTVGTEISTTDLQPGEPLLITADIQNADLEIADFNLFKPKGVPGMIQATLTLPGKDGDDRLDVDNIQINAPTFEIEGHGLFTPEGGLIELSLPQFYIEDQADMAVTIDSQGERLTIDVTGDHADASGLLENILGTSSGGGGLPGAAAISFDLNRIVLRNETRLTDFVLTGFHDGEAIEALNLTSRLPTGGLVRAVIEREEGAQLGNVDVEATDFGTLAKGVLGITSVQGGEGSIKGTTLETGGFRGRVEVGPLLVKEAPTLARILAVGSLDGLSDLLNGEGIRFQEFEADVWLQNGQMGLSDAKLVGTSLGISANGIVDLNQGTIDVRGAVAPAYSVNSILGALPGIGRLFVSRDGEGIVAFSYTITGSIDQPVVTVNTLSALTPGILRRVFEPLVNGSSETRDLLDAAIIAAEEAERLEVGEE
ncbi:MAG: AsmA-like C-terminal domain-containing protein [Pseudomonadota bacterium]